MSDAKLAYGTSNQTITITLASLASSATAGRASTSVDNSSGKYQDALVQVNLQAIGSGTVANDKGAYVYAYGTVDGGTTFSDGVTGSDAALTHSDPPNLRLIGFLSMPTNTGTYKSHPMSVAAAFGGIMPEKWGIVVRNYSGLTLHASGHSAIYQAIYGTVA